MKYFECIFFVVSKGRTTLPTTPTTQPETTPQVTPSERTTPRVITTERTTPRVTPTEGTPTVSSNLFEKRNVSMLSKSEHSLFKFQSNISEPERKMKTIRLKEPQNDIIYIFFQCLIYECIHLISLD